MIATIEQALEDMQHGVYDFTKDGKCVGCGNCCSNLLAITQGEIDRIRRYIKRNHIKEQKHTYPAPLANPPVFDMTCPFLDDSKPKDKCVIYDVRPEICVCFNCHSMDDARNDEVLFAEHIFPVDMRETFFGRRDGR